MRLFVGKEAIYEEISILADACDELLICAEDCGADIASMSGSALHFSLFLQIKHKTLLLFGGSASIPTRARNVDVPDIPKSLIDASHAFIGILIQVLPEKFILASEKYYLTLRE